MDRVQRRVASIVYGMVAEAYGYVPEDQREPAPPCRECGGDGCEACEFSGVEW